MVVRAKCLNKGFVNHVGNVGSWELSDIKDIKLFYPPDYDRPIDSNTCYCAFCKPIVDMVDKRRNHIWDWEWRNIKKH